MCLGVCVFVCVGGGGVGLSSGSDQVLLGQQLEDQEKVQLCA